MDFSVINEKNYCELLEYMRDLSDERYRAFHSKLVPNVNNIMGIRVPLMRKLSKEISKGDYEGFLKACGNKYYEETMLRGLVIAQLNLNYDSLVEYVDNFLNHIDNWAICDTFCSSLKIVRKYRPQFFSHLNDYLNSESCWKIRAGVILMLSHYLDSEYIDRVLERCEKIKSDEYYVKMGNAWLISAAYAKFPEKTRKFLLTAGLDDETFNMTIQKCVESSRIATEEKNYLKNHKRRI